MQIKQVLAKIIKDSRSEETLEVSVNGCSASSPSGKSKGKHETPSYKKDINWNLKSINELKEIMGLEINSFSDLKIIERKIEKKFKLKKAKFFGANALFALESSILKALAKSEGKELWEIINPRARKLPTPLGNSIGGGLHSSNSNLTFQEFLLIPKEKSFSDNYFKMKKIYSNLKTLTNSNKINDEGAWETKLNEESVLELLWKMKHEISFGIDVASSSFFKENYNYKDKVLDRNAQIHFIKEIIRKFKPKYIEDPLQEEDFSGFSNILKNSRDCLIVGDDLTATNLERVKKAVKNKSINATIVKPNQNGSLLELNEIISFCKKNKIKTILSHRSGETMDSALSDYAFGFQADFIKCGIATPYRDIKLKRLVEIEKSIKRIL
jgi:enolase